MPAFPINQNYDLLPLVQAEYLSRGMDGKRLIKLFPLAYRDTSLVEWEQLDSVFGAMQLRGVGGVPGSVQLLGYKQYKMQPGSYGNFIKLDYEQLMKMRQPGTKGDVVDEQWLANQSIMELTEQALNRMEWIVAQWLSTGQFYLASPGGGNTHTDSITNYTTILPSTNWANTAASTPIDDLQNAKARLQKGTSSQFDKKSTFVVNSFTMNDFLQSAQLRNIIKLQYGETPVSLDLANKILNSLELPSIEVYDGGYFQTPGTATSDATNWTYFLPRGYGIWLGHRPDGAQIGEFILTRNPDAMKPRGAATDFRTRNPELEAPDWIDGLYTRFFVNTNEPPTYWRTDCGFNGGPALFYRTGSAGFFYSAVQP